MKRFNLKKLNVVQVKEEYQVKYSNRFVAFKNLGGGGGGGSDDDDDDDDDDVGINGAWKRIRKNTKASATERLSYFVPEHLKTWLGEDCS
jgi:hypothetical protein